MLIGINRKLFIVHSYADENKLAQNIIIFLRGDREMRNCQCGYKINQIQVDVRSAYVDLDGAFVARKITDPYRFCYYATFTFFFHFYLSFFLSFDLAKSET